MRPIDFLKGRQTRYGAYLAVYVIVVLAVLGAINYLANAHNKSYDLTASKKYTLSDQTKKVVAGLKNDVDITYFQKATDFTRGRDLLDRYANLSNKLHVKYVDPDKDPMAARTAGIRSFGTTVVSNGTRTQEAKTLTEEEVTGALIRALKTEQRVACFAVGSGELGSDDQDRAGMSGFKAALEKTTFKTQTVSLLEKAEVPAACSVLVVAGPKRDYVAPAVDAIKKYVDAGGHAMFLIDPAIDFGKGDANSGSPALTAMLAGYGVTLNNDLVIDGSGAGQMLGFNEASPIVLQYESQAIVAGMRQSATVFPLTRSLDVKSPAEKLFSTSERSFATANLKPPIKIDPAKDKKGPFALGAAATVGNKGRIVVVGSSSWVKNEVFGIPQIGNRDLALNSVNWLTADEELIAIRPKDPEDRRISMTQRQMSLLFFLLVVIIPLAVIVTGTSVYLRRR